MEELLTIVTATVRTTFLGAMTAAASTRVNKPGDIAGTLEVAGLLSASTTREKMATLTESFKEVISSV